MNDSNSGKVDLDGLQGWRKAYDKELKYLQGVLLAQAKIYKKNEKRSNILLGMTAFFLTLFLKESIVVAVEAFRTMDVQKILWCIVAIAVVLYLIYISMQMLLNTLKRQTAKRFWHTVWHNEMRITDVNIIENVTKLKSNMSYVMVSDLQQNRYPHPIRIIFSGKYIKMERAYLVEVPLSLERHKLLVIPVHVDNEKMQELAKKCYQKYIG